MTTSTVCSTVGCTCAIAFQQQTRRPAYSCLHMWVFACNVNYVTLLPRRSVHAPDPDIRLCTLNQTTPEFFFDQHSNSRFKLRLCAPNPGIEFYATSLCKLVIFCLCRSHNMRSIILAVDIGSSSVRCSAVCVACHDSFELLSEGRVKHSLNESGTCDPAAMLESVSQAIRLCVERLSGDALAAKLTLCFTSFVGNLVGVDATGRAVTPLYTYANRAESAASVVDDLRLTIDADAHYDRTGAPIHAAYAPCWIRMHEARAAGGGTQPALWTSLSSYLIASWAGLPVSEVGMSVSEAAWAGLLSLHGGGTESTFSYDAQALQAAGISEQQLPPIRDETWSILVPLDAVAGVLFANNAFTGGGCTIAFKLGLGDGAAATVGSVATSSAASANEISLALTIGTSCGLRASLPRALVLAALCSCSSERREQSAAADSSPWCESCSKLSLSKLGLWCYPYSSTLVLLGGALTDGGSLITHLTNTMGASLSGLVSDLSDADGKLCLRPSSVMCLPFWSGERATGWNSSIRGVWAGLDYVNTSPNALLHAAMDGVAFRIKAIRDAIHAVLTVVNPPGDAASSWNVRIVCSGGAISPTHNALWGQIIATVLDCSLVLGSQLESGLELATYGLACYHSRQVAEAKGAASDAPTAVPVAEASSAYAAAYLRHQRLYMGFSCN